MRLIQQFTRSTQSESYATTKKSLSALHTMVLMKVRELGIPVTRNELAKATGLRPCSCTARVKELIDWGKLEVVGTKWDESSKRRVETVQAVSDKPHSGAFEA